MSGSDIKYVNKVTNELANSKLKDTQYYDFGFNIFGPFLYGYTKWLYGSIKQNGIKKVYFFSRDGFMMEKAFSVICKGDIEYRYVYFSRKSLSQALLSECDSYKESLKYLAWERFITFGRLLEYYGFSENERNAVSDKFDIALNSTYAFSDLESTSELKDIYSKLKNDIKDNSLNQRRLLNEYLEQIGMVDDCAIVDIGWHGNMQFYLEEFAHQNHINIEFHGYYVGINPVRPLSGKVHGYLYDRDNQKLRKSVLCFFGGYEKLFQSLDGSTDGYKEIGGIVCPELADYEYKDDEQVIECIQDWQQGAFDFVNLAIKEGLSLSSEKEWAYPLLQFGKSPNMKDIKLLRFLYNTDGNKSYFVSQKPIYQYKPKEFLYALSNSPWKTGFLKSAFKLPFPYYAIYEVLRK